MVCDMTLFLSRLEEDSAKITCSSSQIEGFVQHIFTFLLQLQDYIVTGVVQEKVADITTVVHTLRDEILLIKDKSTKIEADVRTQSSLTTTYHDDDEDNDPTEDNHLWPVEDTDPLVAIKTTLSPRYVGEPGLSGLNKLPDVCSAPQNNSQREVGIVIKEEPVDWSLKGNKSLKAEKEDASKKNQIEMTPSKKRSRPQKKTLAKVSTATEIDSPPAKKRSRTPQKATAKTSAEIEMDTEWTPTNPKNNRPKKKSTLKKGKKGSLKRGEKRSTSKAAKPHECAICDKRFSQRGDLNRHALTHSGVRPFSCERCEKSFGTKYQLMRHQKTCSIKCRICQQTFNSNEELLTHRSEHIDTSENGEETYKCTPCLKTFKVKHYLVRHMATVHATSTETYLCDQCDMSFTLKNTLYSHQRNKHSEVRPHVCDDCGKTFVKPYELKIHAANHSDERPFPCSVCHLRFKTKNAQKSHESRHTTDYPHICPSCGKGFISGSELRNHERYHGDERPFQCAHCERRFVFSGQKKTHERTHTKEKPHLCTVCGMSFREVGVYKRHLRTHTGEKPYHCSHCPKRFPTPTQLTLHERVHTGERPYKCRFCGQGFTQTSSRRTHERQVHPDETLPEGSEVKSVKKACRYRCRFCGKIFLDHGTRKNHERENHPEEYKQHTHVQEHHPLPPGLADVSTPVFTYDTETSDTRPRPYKCRMCGKGFTQASSRGTHEKQVHKKKSNNGSDMPLGSGDMTGDMSLGSGDMTQNNVSGCKSELHPSGSVNVSGDLSAGDNVSEIHMTDISTDTNLAGNELGLYHKGSDVSCRYQAGNLDTVHGSGEISGRYKGGGGDGNIIMLDASSPVGTLPVVVPTFNVLPPVNTFTGGYQQH